MPLEIVRNDITKMKVDAIVNAANNTLLGGGGVDGAVHAAAGPGLLAECRTLGGCETGDAKITGAYDLPCKHVIHTVGPIWQGGDYGEREKLISCYRTSLELARDNNCGTVAFPLISSGIFGYPKDKALKVAIDTISEFLLENDMTVYIVVYSRSAFQISEKLFNDIAEYIDDNYVEAHTDRPSELRRRELLEESMVYGCEGLPDKDKGDAKHSIGHGSLTAGSSRSEGTAYFDEMPFKEDGISGPRPVRRGSTKPGTAAAIDNDKCKKGSASTLAEAIGEIDESFSEMLLRKIDERGITDAQCYRKANIDRKLFSKIRSDKFYKPSKPTVLAFAIALELPLSEAREMLMKAGFAFSRSNKFDIIVEYFISHGNYNIHEINEALFAFDQNLLGA